jgi:tol-pal system protein YbgF
MGLSSTIFAGLLLMICVSLVGCASQQEVSALQRQIWAARRDLDKNKDHLAQLDKTMQEQLVQLDDKLEADRQPLRRSQAEVGAQLDRIELELGRLSGQLEEAAVTNARNEEQISALQEGQMTGRLEMQKTVDDLQRRLSLMANYLGLQELAAAPKTQSQTKKKTVGSKKAAAPTKTAKRVASSGAEQQYGKAFELFQAGQLPAARTEFTNFLQRYPKTDLADNAQFWIGECYYGEKKYREAIAAYEKTIKKYPESDKVGSALLKQGMAFLELGDKTAGKILLKKVVKSYPNSNQAKIAQSKLAKIK